MARSTRGLAGCELACEIEMRVVRGESSRKVGEDERPIGGAAAAKECAEDASSSFGSRIGGLVGMGARLRHTCSHMHGGCVERKQHDAE